MMLVTSCQKELPDDIKVVVSQGEENVTPTSTPTPEEKYVSVTVASLSFSNQAGSESFSVTSNTSWSVTSNQTWCKVSPSSGSNNATLTVNVSENTSTSSRNATITVKAGDIMRTISVSQDGAKNEEPSVRQIYANGVYFKMIRVEGGSFTMGATSEQGAYDWERPAHNVTLSTYYIGEMEVTQALWQAIMGSNPSRFSGSQKPVEQVSWSDCRTFITRLNNLTGYTFRLPTEAEWEYAARGGSKSYGYNYAGSNTVNNVAWHRDNSSGTHNVGQKSSNELGLYDMSGNVWEWCQDRWGYYSSGSQKNPTGPSSGDYRVRRGGGWSSESWDCRVSYRYYYSPSDYYDSIGFRLAL